MKELISEALFFGPALSLLAYEAGLIVKRKFKLAILNPLLIATTIIIGVLAVAGIEYEKYNESAKYISYFLTPATVALAVPLYEQLSLLKKHFAAVMSGIIAGVMASMISILLLSKLFGLTHEQYVTLLPIAVVIDFGMGVSEEMGGIVTITVAVIIITGIVGGITAEFVYKIFRITEPVAKGLALGTSAHAMGTSKAMEMGDVEGAMSSLAIAVAGLLTVVAASVFAEFL